MSKSKELKYYLHLYLGCEAEIERMKYPVSKKIETLLPTHLTLSERQYKIKPTLRPLSDMDDDEYKYCKEMGWADHSANKFTYTSAIGVMEPKEFIWMLSKHFDLFGLIEAGLAIDKTKIKHQ